MNGRLILVPNALDLGADAVDLREVLSDGVIRQASQLRHWVVEDARSARAFLKRIDAVCPLSLPLQQLAVEELPRPRKGSRDSVPVAVWRSLLAPAGAGHDIGLLSEAGLPAVADPGSSLVLAAHAAHIHVLALPGPSSIALALAASGLEGQSFAFGGYLPQDAGIRATRLRELERLSRQLRQTQLMIETPYRNAALLAAMLDVLAPATRLSVSCGLTLPSQWTRTATIAQWRQEPTVMPDRVPAVFALLGA